MAEQPPTVPQPLPTPAESTTAVEGPQAAPAAQPAAAASPEGNSAPEQDDTFSDLGDDITDTTSLRSSILDFQYENGRRYHAYRAGQYLLPNDETEQDRLDMTHHVFGLTLGGEICMTKLENPQSILDIGTGTGIWAIEMGDMFPSAEVIGTDLSPIQPQWVPPNVRFEIDDATQDWTYPENHFDFIHARTMGGSIFDWPTFLRRCYDHLAPGGKIEIAEGRAQFFCDDDTWPPESAMRKWMDEFNRIGVSMGLVFDIIPLIPSMLSDLNFEDVERVDKIVPLGPWPKDKGLKQIGLFFRLQFLEMALEAYTMALFTRNGWTQEETQVLLAQVRNEIKGGKMHLYTHCSYVTGTKPKAAKAS